MPLRGRVRRLKLSKAMQMAALLELMASRIRLCIINILARAGDAGLRTHQVWRAVQVLEEITQPTITYHLKLLKEAGIVRKEGAQYILNPDAVAELTEQVNISAGVRAAEKPK